MICAVFATQARQVAAAVLSTDRPRRPELVPPRECLERVSAWTLNEGRNNSSTESRTKQFTLARIAVSSAEAPFFWRFRGD